MWRFGLNEFRICQAQRIVIFRMTRITIMMRIHLLTNIDVSTSKASVMMVRQRRTYQQ